MFSEYASIAIWILSSIFFILTIVVVAVIISENRNPVRSLAWVTVLLVVPLFGLILYFVFGRDIKNKRVVARSMKRKLRKKENAIKPDLRFMPFNDETKQIIRVANKLAGATYHNNNNAEIFISGEKKFQSLLNDIENAKRYIYIQYYIISDDKIGNKICNKLIEKAQHGVKVHLIYDPVGSVGTGKKFFKRLTEAGINVKPFIPVRFPAFGTRINWRNHRKQSIIDGRIGYIGGMNIADRYIDGGKKFDMWRDIHLRIEGSVVSSIESSFITDWSFMGNDYDTLLSNYKPEPRITGDFSMQYVTSGPTSQWFNIEMLYLKAIGSARKRVYIETPYFLPTEGLINVLQSAALGGVDVRILIPRHSDSAILTYASSSYVSECLKAGIKIYLYEKGMLHSKMMLIDDEIVTVGSTNFDFRSFEHNFEGNMFIYSHDFNEETANAFIAALSDSSRVKYDEWMKRKLSRRAKESLMRLLAPIL